MVAELLRTSDECLTVEEIYARLRSLDQRIGLTSVYRTVKLLVKTLAIVRVEVGDGVARYEPAERSSEEHHHHLVCVRCRRVVRYDSFSSRELTLMRETERDLNRRFGYRITGHRVYFEGVCPDCENAG